MSRKIVFIIVVGLVLLSLSNCSLAEKEKTYYLVGNVDQVKGKVDKQETSFRGQIGFRVVTGKEGQLTFFLDKLNLMATGVPTDSGNSGIISLVLVKPESKMSYDPSSGQLTAEFKSTLHYELIDKIKGYRQVEGKYENDVFPPYTEEMTGKLVGKFPEKLKAAEKGRVTFVGELQLEISKKVLGLISSIYLTDVRFQLEWIITAAKDG
jgi:hypothetical protein